MSYEMSDDAKVIFLLCAKTEKPSGPDEIRTLTPTEYSDLALWLDDRSRRPDDLYDETLLEELEAFDPARFPKERLEGLFDRAPSLMLNLEKWINRNIWLVTRSDDDYPRGLKKKLGRSAPPFFYGTGERELLHRSGLGMVGSRDADEEALDFTRLAGRRCAHEGIIVISGGARGIDEAAMLSCLESGGYAVGVLPHGLARFSMTAPFRDFLIAERLLLLSPYGPDSEFSAGAALGRNRYIFLLSKGTWAISSGESGGTWSGATENLKHDWVPLWVRDGKNVPPGNRKLLELGGRPLTRETLEAHSILDILKGKTAKATSTEEDLDLFPAVLPGLLKALDGGATVGEMAERLHVVEEQARIWLERGLNEGILKRCGPGRFCPFHPDDEGKGTSSRRGPQQILMFPA